MVPDGPLPSDPPTDPIRFLLCPGALKVGDIRVTRGRGEQFRLFVTLLLVGFGRGKPNDYCQHEHESPCNQMIAVKVRSEFGYMLRQKRQAAKRQ